MKRCRLAVPIVLLVSAGTLGACSSTPSQATLRHELLSDWNKLVAMNKSKAGATPRNNVAPLQKFAGQVGQLSLPSGDQPDAHALIRAAVAVQQDESNATWEPTPEMCAIGAKTGCWIDPPSFTKDESTFNSDFRTLYADLGGT